jgi:hypothetical protein
MEKTLDLKMPGVMELGREELTAIDGGNVPTSYYMDDDTIAANGEAINSVLPIYGKVIGAFWKEIVKFVFLG